MLRFALLALLAIVPPDPGPAPLWEEAVVIGNKALLGSLVDPDSARVSWPNRFVARPLKGLLNKRPTGWYTCGLVNARNRMGGYTGKVSFLIMIRDGAVRSLEIGKTNGIDLATIICDDMGKRGDLLPSGAGTALAPISITLPSEDVQRTYTANATTAASKGGLGIGFVAAPAGLVIMAIAPGSPAARAGIQIGQVLQSVNGINLRGMPADAASAVLYGQAHKLQFEIAGGGNVLIVRE